MIAVRTLRPGDPFPQGFNTGYEKMPVMKSWVWIAESNDEVVGVLLAAPMHGLIYIMRLCIRDGAPTSTGVSLFRAFMRDALQRGFKGFLAHIDPTKEPARFISMCRRAGGRQLSTPQVLLTGWIEKAARF